MSENPPLVIVVNTKLHISDYSEEVFWRSFIERPVLPEAAGLFWYSRDKQKAQAYALMWLSKHYEGTAR